MAYEKSVTISDINRSMFKCPWLEYPERTKGEAEMDRSGVRDRDLKRKAPWHPLPGRGLGDVSRSMGRGRADPWILSRLSTALRVSLQRPLRWDVSVSPQLLPPHLHPILTTPRFEGIPHALCSSPSSVWLPPTCSEDSACV